MPDQYTNRGTIHVVESGLNTITFQQLQTGVNVFDKRAIVINRIEYTLRNSLSVIIPNDGDGIAVGICTSNRVSTLWAGGAFSDPAVVDTLMLKRSLLGAALILDLDVQPITHSFETLPGGGLIIPAAPVYAVAEGSGASAAGSWDIRFNYQMIDLKPDEYIELVESQRILS